MRKILFFLLFISSQLLFSQNTNYEKFEKEYSLGNMRQALNYLEKSLDANEQDKMVLYQKLGEVNSRLKNYKESAIYYENMLQLMNENNDLGELYYIIGTNYYFSQEYTKGIEYLLKLSLIHI